MSGDRVLRCSLPIIFSLSRQPLLLAGMGIKNGRHIIGTVRFAWRAAREVVVNGDVVRLSGAGQ